MKKVHQILLSLNHFRKYSEFKNIIGVMKQSFEQQICDPFVNKKILALSPHPDDTVFGCAGMIYQSVNQGSIVTEVTVTNGFDAARVKESQEAGKIIGITNQIFWDIKDNELLCSKENIDKLKEIIKKEKPDVIFLPSFFDPNNDHFELTKILARTLENTEFLGEIWQYEVWQPVFLNRLLDIDKCINIKKSAIKCYKSQIKQRPFEKAIPSLNKYRGGMFGISVYAEAFLATNKELFIEALQG